MFLFCHQYQFINLNKKGSSIDQCPAKRWCSAVMYELLYAKSQMVIIGIALPWCELLYDVPCLPLYIFCKWKLCFFSLLFSIIVMTSYFCCTNKYSKRKKVSFGVVLLHKFYLRVFLERLIALLENTLDGQLSLIWDLQISLKSDHWKTWHGSEEPPLW